MNDEKLNSFQAVFSNIDIPDSLNNTYKNALVTSININRASRAMDVYITLDNMNGTSAAQELSSILKKEFHYLSNINVHLKYNIEKIVLDNPMAQDDYQARQDEEIAKAIALHQKEVSATMENRPYQKQSNSSGNVISYKGKFQGGRRSALKIVDNIDGEITKLGYDLKEQDIIIAGSVFFVDIREKGDLRIVIFDVYDGFGSIEIKFFTNVDSMDKYKPFLKNGVNVIVSGKIQYDSFSKEMILNAREICMGEETIIARVDDAPVKRVELHLHTTMSQMDSTTPVSSYIKKAKAWGHTALAITDHGVVQAYPEAGYEKDLKILYGIEAYIVDDQSAIVSSAKKQTLDAEYVVFDIETTGLSKDKNKIIEIGAVKINNGVIIDDFSSLIDPGEELSDKIKELTKITDEMLAGKPLENEIIPKFLEWCGDAVLVAHNANFDVGFIRNAVARMLDQNITNTVLDTVELSRMLLPKIKNHKLNTVAEHFGVALENHHRAVDDAVATAHVFINLCKMLKEEMNIDTLEGINQYASQFIDTTKIRDHHHVTILVQTQEGLRNLYELVSLSHIKYFYRNNRRPKTSRPRIPIGELTRLREGLIIGSACLKGQVYKSILDNKPEDEVLDIANFYDYLEVQPHVNYAHKFGSEGINRDIKEINKKIVEIGDELGKIVVATGDVHFLDPGDEIYRRVILFGEGSPDFSAPLYFRTTNEMLELFDYLGKEKAYEVVVTNTNKIADSIDIITPIPKGTFPPEIEGSETELREISYKNAKNLYGDPLPTIVSERLDKELNSIIDNGYAVMYMSAHLLIKGSLDNKYTVGSRGSVGSSFAATMSDVTEVNPLPAHYLCMTCKHSEFDSPEVIELGNNMPGASGCDLPDKDCPNCKTPMHKEGHDIPFETFLGFEGDKEPDIDLNFSGEYQARAHEHASELFGDEKVFKAGTISTLADKTAFGYTMKYIEANQKQMSKAEINRIKIGATGVKKTTGQHPGGLMIVPKDRSIYDFTPIQRPSNDVKSNVTTTHFDYKAISGRLLKLDLLGHDVPTIIKHLWDITGLDPRTVPLSEPKVISLFNEPDALGLTSQIVETGSLGIPEFGTQFVRGMLLDTKPQSFGELVRISGLSHGTDVWLNNAQSLIKNGTCTLKDVIATRDDIMVYLIAKGLEKKLSFAITEDVRKGKGLTQEFEEEMLKQGVPDWYIDSCKKIKYMFPKGHAVAYVMMAVRIAYFKVYHPEAFYTVVFSVKAGDFDYESMCLSHNKLREKMRGIKNNPEATAVEKNTYGTLELVNEMYERGLKFAPLNLYKAESTKFVLTEQGIMPPLSSISGLGETVAQKIIEARQEHGEFISIEDFKEKTGATKKTIDLLVSIGVLDGMPADMQLTLF